jgi:hypothetical protein
VTVGSPRLCGALSIRNEFGNVARFDRSRSSLPVRPWINRTRPPAETAAATEPRPCRSLVPWHHPPLLTRSPTARQRQRRGPDEKGERLGVLGQPLTRVRPVAPIGNRWPRSSRPCWARGLIGGAPHGTWGSCGSAPSGGRVDGEPR